ncbi:MAG: endonuclease/exonuclease/phosphatase family protein [Tannerellaceae bacterium]|nr:endonuclease/exonuclease/phosphatase family protein [Tannerellaceae bacterium]
MGCGTPGTRDNQILKLRLAVVGEENPLTLSALQLDLSRMTNLADVEQVTLYYTGDKARSTNRRELSRRPISTGGQLTLSGKDLLLTPGIHYLLVTADIHPGATEGNRIKMSVPSFTLNGKPYQPESSPGMYDKQIVCNSSNQPDVLKVLQWNIWNSGNCLGNDGLNQVIRLIRESEADIITMQEGYGSQYTIAEALGYNLLTPSPSDNLALFSRYPMAQLPSSKTFQSNPALIHHPDGSRLLVNSSWLRYSYEPEYTGNYPEKDHDTSLWIAEDSIRPMKDVAEILATDVEPCLEKDMAVIIGGDFNSCSHLDWTEAAAHLHYGYGPVDFPTSRYMQQAGYKDSFRELHPDEVARPDGTFAVIYGHLQHSRIDYIYYKGDNIRATYSKIIRTSPEIDDVWPSDHEAVITTFRK